MKINQISLILIILILCSDIRVYSCTIFLASKNGKVLAGNNEDFIDPNTNIWFLPPEAGKFGRVYFGFGVGLPQGGINDQGLFFDYAALPFSPTNNSVTKKIFNGSMVEKVMEEFTTIDQVVNFFSLYDRQHMATYQLMFGDRDGNSVIIERDTIIIKKADYQICTNFRQSLNEEKPYSIERYNIVENMLKESDEISVDLFRSILAGVHQEPGQKQGSPTMYSNIYDLKNGIIYVYHFHNYLDCRIIDVKKELEKGKHSYSIADLFEHSLFAYDVFAERSKIIKPTAITVESSEFKNFVGEYHLTPIPAFHFTIRTENQKLFCLIRGLGEFEILPESDLKYFINEADMQFEFIKNEEEKVNDFTFIMYGTKIPAKRVD